MPIKKDFKKISDYIWEIPKSYRSDPLDKLGIKMRVPARIFVNEEMLEDCSRDRSIDQMINVATLPGIQKYSIAMPDAHEGYGFPIGGVAAMKLPDGVISPGGIGYDINCGVRLLKSQISYDEIKPYLTDLANQLQRDIPSGLGRGGELKLNDSELNKILKYGVRRMIEMGYGKEKDLEHIESFGSMKNADPSMVSSRAKNRGRDQLGTVGSGNHFLEVDRITKIFDKEAADVLGLKKNGIAVLIHTGSRGLGHQVATDYIKIMMGAMPKYDIKLPDRELACVPFNSPEGQNYFAAMNAAANFAWSNRQMIMHLARIAWKRILGDKSFGGLEIVYDVAHNMAKIEKHNIDGKEAEVIMHRKGATRAFASGHPEIPEDYREIGQPVLIPGSMGTASYVLIGTEKGEKECFASSCHGAGRRMSRHQALKMVNGEQLKKELETRGIIIRGGSMRGLAEEAPLAYKDIDNVVNVVHNVGIAKKVVKLEPIAVIKG